MNEYHLNRCQLDKPQIAIHDLNEYLRKHQEHITKPHFHSFYQIIWFRNGNGKHYIDLNEYIVSENIIFFIGKNQVHCFDININYNGVLIHFNETFLIHRHCETDFFLKYNFFINPYKQQFCRIELETSLILNDYVLQIKREFENINKIGKQELLHAYLKSFLIQTFRTKIKKEQLQNNSSFKLDKNRLQIFKFINLIEDNYTKGLSVKDYSSLLFVSTRTLANLTNLLLNKTPIQMTNERIIVETQRLLIHTEMNINQIGYILGFNDSSYFVKFFKKHTKITPSEFRKSNS